MTKRELVNPELVPGARVSYRIWTDVVPLVVLKRTPKTLLCAELDATPAPLEPGEEPRFGRNKWIIAEEPRPDARRVRFTLRNTGAWKVEGTRTRETGNVLTPGCRRYDDPHF